MAWDYVYTNGYPTVDTTGNAELGYTYLTQHGVTSQAACAILGNMQYESGGLNTGQWQHDYAVDDWANAGFGLGQWTPAQKYKTYMNNTSDIPTLCNGDNQLQFLIDTPSQWLLIYLNPDGTSTYYNLSGVPYYSTFEEFLQATDNVQDMATAYMVCWERPNNQNTHLDLRKQYAQYWWDYFGGVVPPTPHPSSGRSIRKMPIWMYPMFRI